MFSTETLAKNIKSFRKTCNMTQEQLAEMMNVSVQAVSKWECGKSIPELSSLYDLSKIFKVTIDEIVRDYSNDQRLIRTLKLVEVVIARAEKRAGGLILSMAAEGKIQQGNYLVIILDDVIG